MNQWKIYEPMENWGFFPTFFGTPFNYFNQNAENFDQILKGSY